MAISVTLGPTSVAGDMDGTRVDLTNVKAFAMWVTSESGFAPALKGSLGSGGLLTPLQAQHQVATTIRADLWTFDEAAILAAVDGSNPRDSMEISLSSPVDSLGWVSGYCGVDADGEIAIRTPVVVDDDTGVAFSILISNAASGDVTVAVQHYARGQDAATWTGPAVESYETQAPNLSSEGTAAIVASAAAAQVMAGTWNGISGSAYVMLGIAFGEVSTGIRVDSIGGDDAAHPDENMVATGSFPALVTAATKDDGNNVTAQTIRSGQDATAIPLQDVQGHAPYTKVNGDGVLATVGTAHTWELTDSEANSDTHLVHQEPASDGLAQQSDGSAPFQGDSVWKGHAPLTGDQVQFGLPPYAGDSGGNAKASLCPKNGDLIVSDVVDGDLLVIPRRFYDSAVGVEGWGAWADISIQIGEAAGPVFNGPIPDQQFRQGDVVSLDLSGYWDNEASYSDITSPSGLSINATTGILEGTPDTEENVAAQYQAQNAQGVAPSNVFSITITDGKPLAPSAPVLVGPSQTGMAIAWADAADNETEYEAEYRVSGSGDPWTLGGVLAANAQSDVLTGMTADTSYNVRVRAGNAYGSNYSPIRTFDTLVVDIAPTFTGPILNQTDQENRAFSRDFSGFFTNMNGAPNPVYSIQAGTLPAGTTFDTATCVVSGTPAAQGTQVGIVIRGSNDAGNADSNAFDWTIVEADLPTDQDTTLRDGLGDAGRGVLGGVSKGS